MADEWPFLHLNMIPPHPEQLPGSNEELSLLPFDPSHLEAWTNITFQFDEPNVVFNNNNTNLATASDTQNSISPTDHIGHELLHSAADIQFQLPNDHNLPPYLESKNQSQQLAYLDRTSTQQAAIDAPNHPTALTKSSIEAHHQSTTSPRNTKSKQADEHTSPVKNDPTSPNHQQTNSNHGSNDDDADNRIAHDEDKRRRNTLASARFRMKKKMKEQEIERTAREMRDRVSELEKEVDSLKQENKWLRGLIVDSTASKLVSVQAKETAELNHVEANSSNKRPNPVLGIAADSIRVPTYPQKRHRMCSSPTSSNTAHSTSTCNFSPPPFPR